MSQVCSQIPGTLPSSSQSVSLLSAQLSATFFLSTFIHAKEKPTLIQWMDLLTKQLVSCTPAGVWFLESCATVSNSWLSQILLKCPSQLVRQLFARLCFHVVQSLRSSQTEEVVPMVTEDAVVPVVETSPIPVFIRRYLSLVSAGF